MESLKHLPEVNEKMRGGVASLGYDRVVQLRDEIVLLENVAASVVGVTREELTKTHLIAFVQARDAKTAAAQAMTPGERTTQAEAVAAALPGLLDATDRASVLRDVVTSAIAFAQAHA